MTNQPTMTIRHDGVYVVQDTEAHIDRTEVTSVLVTD